MAFVGSRVLGRWKSQGGSRLLGRKGRAGQVVLRARSKRAYCFEVHPRATLSDLWEVGAVYAYARAAAAEAPDAARDAGATGLEVGYVGKTDNMSRQDAEHEARGHFAGHGFDIVLILRIEQAPIRDYVERDLAETFNPGLNDLLRGSKPDQVS